MSVDFCIVAGSWLKVSGVRCGSEGTTPLEESTPMQLGQLGQGIKQERLSPGGISVCLNRFKQSKWDNAPEIERFRTFFTLLQSKAICCVNFIPLNPQQLQIIHVMRLRPNEDPAKVSVFCHSHIFKYILPAKHADVVFDLSRERVSDTTQSLESSLKAIIEDALEYFKKDLQAQGIALTFTEKGVQKTYIWLKKRSPNS
ncbi:MAG TPA: hypothetical protein VFU89_06795 [Rhabdochlamydiaceae bacterium]|nr:hypothetical protein [Rhabdochlamydiaceae bacterium]